MSEKDIRIDGEEILLSSKRCAAFFGVTTKTIRRWRQEGCHCVERGWWNLHDVYEWRMGISQAEDAQNADVTSWALKKMQADADLKCAKAEQEKIKLEVMRRNYVPMDTVQASWCDRLTVCRVNMFAWIHTLPPVLEGLNRSEIEEILDNEIRGLWEAYSQNGPFTPFPLLAYQQRLAAALGDEAAAEEQRHLREKTSRATADEDSVEEAQKNKVDDDDRSN